MWAFDHFDANAKCVGVNMQILYLNVGGGPQNHIQRQYYCSISQTLQVDVAAEFDRVSWHDLSALKQTREVLPVCR